MKKLLALFAVLFSATALWGQQSWVNVDWYPQKNSEGFPAMGARVISPEVHDDHTVTFRLYAPKARRVIVSGSMFTGGMDVRMAEMTQDKDGIWSVTAGPFTPDVYTYTFNIDGVSTIDPANTLHNHGTMPASSMLYVHNDKPAYYDPNPDVPHGDVITSYYNSPVTGGLRTILVYTPPQYDKKKKYPVLYLMGGSGEATDSWYKYGQLNFIMDNLIAEGKIKPTIVVMPNNQVVHRNNPQHSELSFKMTEKELVEVVVPWVDAHYSTIKTNHGRALSGLSMGGRHTQYVGFRHPEVFGSLGILSAALQDADEKAFGKDDVAMGRDVNALKGKFDYIFIGAGKYETNDSSRHTMLHKQLEAEGIEHQYYVGGFSAHDFMTWRHLLYYEFLPNLWKK
ncbi:MAG: esterase [Bacteroidales bacterium]|nr:esterase [Bacteroidales bacterium]